ncbi:hypothetical protein SHELI_v1c09900 [Spiroplasma helicoides]|uniref:KAP NTPase domain-containing protein n=1 Tax=Spiroplasma helicoides TaxID=216938 RepID=A0A1B3SM00_9MOLU|nr:P-loop NTPase fold protein [Spiroplasma helicoides]AOG60937.1 hypothetical protein SHELI_v1c09900 [Spiroplasma helicoides]
MKLEKIVDIINSKINNYFKLNSYINNLLINGEWGVGKTTIIKEVMNKQKEKNTKTYIFDMWKYEINDSNFLYTFLITLTEEFFLDKLIEKEKKEKRKEFFNIIKNFFLQVPFAFLKKYTGVEIQTPTKENKELLSKSIDENYSTDQALKSLINFFKECLNKKQNENYIIVFDDIDRCSNEHIIKFITCIKNVLFSIEDCNNIFFIVSMNKNYVNNLFDKHSSKENFTDKIFNLSYTVNEILDFSSSATIIDNVYISYVMKNYSFKNFRVAEKCYQIAVENNEDELEVFMMWFMLYSKSIATYKKEYEELKFDINTNIEMNFKNIIDEKSWNDAVNKFCENKNILDVTKASFIDFIELIDKQDNLKYLNREFNVNYYFSEHNFQNRRSAINFLYNDRLLPHDIAYLFLKKDVKFSNIFINQAEEIPTREFDYNGNYLITLKNYNINIDLKNNFENVFNSMGLILLDIFIAFKLESDKFAHAFYNMFDQSSIME